MNPGPHDPRPDPADRRPRLGELLIDAGVLTQEQLEESLSIQLETGKRLGHVLVEYGLVPTHSIAMALADQHGGPLKTEFGFATGRAASVRSTPDLAREAPGDSLPPLRLASSTGVAPEPVSTPVPLPADSSAPPQPAALLALRTVVDTTPEPTTPEPLTATAAVLGVQREAETAARASAELRAKEFRARVDELQADFQAAGPRAAEEAAAPLQAEIEELPIRLEAQTAMEQTPATSRDQLATAVAAAEELRTQLDAERATTEQAAMTVDTLRAAVEELRIRHVAESAAASAAEEMLAAVRDQLATALADAETSRANLAAERSAHEREATVADELGARVSALEKAVQEGRVSVEAPMRADVDELRAVIQLQEQALAAAAGQEQTRDRGAARVVDPASARSYSNDSHFLFASNAGGYELLERSGPSPSIGSVVELSGGRLCRVVRVGPAPFSGPRVACAYLEIT